MFFIHEFLPSQSHEYVSAKNVHKELKHKRQLAEKKVKLLSKGTVEYAKYEDLRNKAKNAWNKLKTIKENNKFLGFTNIQQFLGEFGWAFGLALYALLNLSRAYRLRSEESEKLKHLTLLTIAVYFILYTVQPFNDFSKSLYFTCAGICSTIMLFTIKKMHSESISNLFKIQTIKKLLPNLLTDINRVRDIATIMPENPETTTYKAMLDVETEDLRATAKKIEKTLKN